MGQTLGKSHQFKLATQIYKAFGTEEFVAEDMNKHGIPAHGGQLNGMVNIGLLLRKRIHKAARNSYQLKNDMYERCKRRWE